MIATRPNLSQCPAIVSAIDVRSFQLTECRSVGVPLQSSFLNALAWIESVAWSNCQCGIRRRTVEYRGIFSVGCGCCAKFLNSETHDFTQYLRAVADVQLSLNFYPTGLMDQEVSDALLLVYVYHEVSFVGLPFDAY